MLEFHAENLLPWLYQCQTQPLHFVEVSLEPKLTHLTGRLFMVSAFQDKKKRLSWTTGNISQVEKRWKNAWIWAWLHLKCGNGTQPGLRCSVRVKRWSYTKQIIPDLDSKRSSFPCKSLSYFWARARSARTNIFSHCFSLRLLLPFQSPHAVFVPPPLREWANPGPGHRTAGGQLRGHLVLE